MKTFVCLIPTKGLTSSQINFNIELVKNFPLHLGRTGGDMKDSRFIVFELKDINAKRNSGIDLRYSLPSYSPMFDAISRTSTPVLMFPGFSSNDEAKLLMKLFSDLGIEYDRLDTELLEKHGYYCPKPDELLEGSEEDKRIAKKMAKDCSSMFGEISYTLTPPFGVNDTPCNFDVVSDDELELISIGREVTFEFEAEGVTYVSPTIPIGYYHEESKSQCHVFAIEHQVFELRGTKFVKLDRDEVYKDPMHVDLDRRISIGGTFAINKHTLKLACIPTQEIGVSAVLTYGSKLPPITGGITLRIQEGSIKFNK